MARRQLATDFKRTLIGVGVRRVGWGGGGYFTKCRWGSVVYTTRHIRFVAAKEQATIHACAGGGRGGGGRIKKLIGTKE